MQQKNIVAVYQSLRATANDRSFGSFESDSRNSKKRRYISRVKGSMQSETSLVSLHTTDLRFFPHFFIFTSDRVANVKQEHVGTRPFISQINRQCIICIHWKFRISASTSISITIVIGFLTICKVFVFNKILKSICTKGTIEKTSYVQ